MKARSGRLKDNDMAKKSERHVGPSTLGYALLGLLARGEQSGYELAQGLKDPVAFFWYAQHSQIYPELGRLEASGYVTYTRIEQTDRPDKKVYRLTEHGHDALVNWLNAPTAVPQKRDEVVLKVFSLWLARPGEAVEYFQEHAEIHAANKAEYERRLEVISEKYGAAIWQVDSPWFGVHAVLRRGIGYESEYQSWCEWMIQALRQQHTALSQDKE